MANTNLASFRNIKVHAQRWKTTVKGGRLVIHSLIPEKIPGMAWALIRYTLSQQITELRKKATRA